jgi:arabinogalactan endo-1,4-beta-galactosidase
VGSSRSLKTRRRLAVLATAVAAVLGAAAPAGAAVPREWFGVMGDGPLLRDARVDLDAETRLMAASGVGSVRVALYWSDMERSPGQMDWAATDRIVGSAARAGIRVLPTVVRTPDWAAVSPGSEGTPPRNNEDYARFLRATVARYGNRGVFWAEHPELRALPPRMWQVWNEPDIGRYWTAKPWVTTYLRLLKAGRQAIKSVDPGAKIVLGGLTNYSWEELRDIYRAGGRKLFDVAAIHPFSRRPQNVLKIVKLARRAMIRGGDRRKPLLLTEVSWSSGQGRSNANYGWETTEAGQAQRIRQAIPLLARNRKKLGIAGFHWFTWLSPPLGSIQSFDYAGLRRMDGATPVSKPALSAYSSVSRKLRR